MNETQTKLDKILKLLISSKELLDIEELSEYVGFSKDYIYKLTSRKAIPYYRPSGKKIFFKKSEIDAWILSNRHATHEEIQKLAEDYVLKHKN